jgi:hypothetical protein
VRSDNGSEFISDEFKKLLEKHNISQVLSQPAKPQSNGAIERFNKTLKRSLKMAIYSNDNKDWTKYIDSIIDNYNNSVHEVTKKTPNELDEEEDRKILKDVKNKIVKKVGFKEDAQKFNVGDRVRRKLGEDERTDGQTWSKNIFTVYKINKPKKDSTMTHEYYIKDDDTNYITKYYNNDLMKITEIENEKKEKENIFIVSKLIKPVIRNKQPYYVVRWKYYTAKDDTEEPRENLIIDVPKMVNQFEKDNNVVWKEIKNGLRVTWNK